MDAQPTGGVTPAHDSAFEFHGNWREYAPIAFTNLLLSIVTLGIYRFWATTRERRYLWSRTRFIDERLEWTGTGMELFVGFLMVLALFGLPLVILQFGVQALALQGHEGLAGLVSLAMFALIFFLVGVARFRALRYRLGRTWWHGIRGGSDLQGLGYGWSYVWKTTAGYLPGGLLIPWSMVSLWNERWQAMSFGPHPFRCRADFSALMWRFLLFYLVPVALVVGGIVLAVMVALGYGAGMLNGLDGDVMAGGAVLAGIVVVAFIAAIYLLLPIIWLFYYSAFFRVAVGALSLHDLDFAFTARTKDWLILVLVDILLVIGTLGLGALFLGYRHWKFLITHLEAYGEVDLAALTQSTTRQSRHGEGLLDAFDVGAI